VNARSTDLERTGFSVNAKCYVKATHVCASYATTSLWKTDMWVLYWN